MVDFYLYFLYFVYKKNMYLNIILTILCLILLSILILMIYFWKKYLKKFLVGGRPIMNNQIGNMPNIETSFKLLNDLMKNLPKNK